MNPTEFFRFVQRVSNGPTGQPVIAGRFLQQWWESEKMIPNPPGEWRDVPLLPEDDRPPQDIPEFE